MKKISLYISFIFLLLITSCSCNSTGQDNSFSNQSSNKTLNSSISFSANVSEESQTSKESSQDSSSSSFSSLSSKEIETVIEDENCIYEYSSNENCYSVRSKNAGISGVVSIRSSFSDIDVSIIEKSAFENCSNVTAFYIPDNITIIEEKAFKGCTSVVSFSLPNSVESIGFGAFSGCNSLTSISIPLIGNGTNSTNYLGYIFGANSYTENENVIPHNLAFVQVGERCEEIQKETFFSCNYLKTIVLSSSVKFIENESFATCSNLESLTLPFVGETENSHMYDGRSSIGHVFGQNEYSGTEKVVEYLSSSANDQMTYYYPSSLKEITILGGNIDDFAFSCCPIKSIIIQGKVKKIGYHAFYSCEQLESVLIKEGVVLIGDYAFESCKSLKTVSIPNSVKAIGYEFLGDLSSDSSVFNQFGGGLYVGNENNPYLIFMRAREVLSSIHEDCKLINNGISLNGKMFSQITTAHNNCLYVGKIGNPYFVLAGTSDDSLTSVTIHQNCEHIGYRALYHHEQLQSIVIPDNVKAVGNSSFYMCSSLKSVTLGKSVAVISREAFSKCASLETISIPESLLMITHKSFEGCDSLKKIVLPKNLMSFMYSSFDNATLDSLTISDDNCSYINSNNIVYSKDKKEALVYVGRENETVNIPDTVEHLSRPSFYKHDELKSIFAGKNTLFIGSSCFANCTSLQSVTFGDKVVKINSSAFFNCSSLNNIVIPKSVKRIYTGTFRSCTSLSNITYEGTMAEFENIFVVDLIYTSLGIPATSIHCSDGDYLLS